MPLFWRQPGLPAPAAEVGRGRQRPKQERPAVPLGDRVVSLDPGEHPVAPEPPRLAVHHLQAERPLTPSPRVGQQVVLAPLQSAGLAVPRQSEVPSHQVEQRNRVVEQVGEATEAHRVRAVSPRQVVRPDRAEARPRQQVETPVEPAAQTREEPRPAAATLPSAASRTPRSKDTGPIRRSRFSTESSTYTQPPTASRIGARRYSTPSLRPISQAGRTKGSFSTWQPSAGGRRMLGPPGSQ